MNHAFDAHCTVHTSTPHTHRSQACYEIKIFKWEIKSYCFDEPTDEELSGKKTPNFKWPISVQKALHWAADLAGSGAGSANFLSCPPL